MSSLLTGTCPSFTSVWSEPDPRSSFSAGLHVTRAILTNVLEEELGSPLKVGSSFDGEDATVDLEFRGFEIKTVKLTIGDMASK